MNIHEIEFTKNALEKVIIELTAAELCTVINALDKAVCYKGLPTRAMLHMLKLHADLKESVDSWSDREFGAETTEG